MTEDEMVGWHHQLDGHEFEQAPEDDEGLPGSSVHGILQARILEWVAICFSKGSSRPRDQTRISHTAGRHFTL